MHKVPTLGCFPWLLSQQCAIRQYINIVSDDFEMTDICLLQKAVCVMHDMSMDKCTPFYQCRHTLHEHHCAHPDAVLHC